MADGTAISWAEATWSPITGCSVLSSGCTNCYAMKLAGTRLKHHWSREGLTKQSKAGPVWTGEVRFNEAWLAQPLRWRRPRMVFVCAHADLFHAAVPDAWIDRVFAVMALAPQHVFMVLTKRTARLREYAADVPVHSAPGRIGRLIHPLAAEHGGNASTLWQAQDRLINWPLPNVWIGTSVEDQLHADQRIPELLATPAALHWISAEPLLGPIDVARYLPARMACSGCGYRTNDQRAVTCCSGHCLDPTGNSCNSWPCPRCGRHHYWTGSMKSLRWVVAGGESQNSDRPTHPDWFRSLRDQCAAAGVPFHFKQWGDWRPLETSDRDIGHRLERPDVIPRIGVDMVRVGAKAAGRTLDGRVWDEFPERTAP